MATRPRPWSTGEARAQKRAWDPSKARASPLPAKDACFRARTLGISRIETRGRSERSWMKTSVEWSSSSKKARKLPNAEGNSLVSSSAARSDLMLKFLFLALGGFAFYELVARKPQGTPQRESGSVTWDTDPVTFSPPAADPAANPWTGAEMNAPNPDAAAIGLSDE